MVCRSEGKDMSYWTVCPKCHVLIVNDIPVVAMEFHRTGYPERVCRGVGMAPRIAGDVDDSAFSQDV